MRSLTVVALGRMGYREAHALQRELCDRRISGDIPTDLLLLLEHDRTITLGRGTRPESLPLSATALEARGLDVVEVERGGDVTWHGPGQLVGYPILKLTEHTPDLHWYLRQVEEALLRALADLGLGADRHPGQTGVWIRGRKIASIGIHVRQWVTTHGFALNVSNTFEDFGLIVPCGIPGVEMTSVARELTDAGSVAGPIHGSSLWERSLASVTAHFGGTFGLEPRSAPLSALMPEGTTAAPGA